MVKPGSRKEGLVVGGVMAAILIPLRFLIGFTLDDSWIGTLGVVGGVTMTVLLLSLRGRLGWYGEMVIRQTAKFHSSRKKVVMTVWLCVMVVYGGGGLYLMEVGGSAEHADFKEVMLVLIADDLNVPQEVLEYETILEKSGDIPIEDYAAALIDFPGLLVSEFVLVAVTMSIADDLMDGWGSFIFAIVAVESAEGIILIYASKRLLRLKAEKADG